jgi:hypothetical protein
MAFEITKNFPGTDFPALTKPTPDPEVLQAQINAVISSARCIGIVLNPGTCKLQFDATPSAGDLALINSTCAAHVGNGFEAKIQKVFSEAVQTEAGTAYLDKASLVSGLLAGGDYLINWYCEISVALADLTSGALARVLWDGTERAECVNDLAFYTAFSGLVVVTQAQLSAPSLTIQLRRVGTVNTAQIRRVRLSVVLLPT